MLNKKLIIFIVSALILNSCSGKQAPNVEDSSTKYTQNSEKGLYSLIYTNILNKNIDAADDSYIKLKSEYDSSKYLNSAAETLAVVHMQNGEHILANYYLQEALQANSSDEFSKFLLVKNQFLSANRNNRDLNYMNKALEALKINQNLVYGDYAILANSMLIRVKLDMAWKNSQIGNLYKRLNKENAYNIYKQKVENLGVNIEDIVRK